MSLGNVYLGGCVEGAFGSAFLAMLRRVDYVVYF